MDQGKTKLDKIKKDFLKKEGLQEAIKEHMDSLVESIDTTHLEHPTSYIFAFEYVGDRRCSIRHKKTDSYYTGYSSCDIAVEFKSEIN